MGGKQMARGSDVTLRTMRLVTVLVMGLLLVNVAGAAAALPERTIAEDRNDTRGRMDAAEIRYVHQEGLPPVWRVSTYGEWKPLDIWDAGFVWIELDTRYNEASDYFVLLRADRNTMRGALFRAARVPGARDAKLADLDVWKRAPRDVAVRLPLRLMVFGERRTTFRWWVVTSFVGEVCRRTCFDLVPDDQMDAVSQDAPGGPPPEVTARE